MSSTGTVRAAVVVGEAAGSAEVKQAADSSHGNRPVLPADTDDCQRKTTGAVMVHWANPQLSLLSLSSVLAALNFRPDQPKKTRNASMEEK